MTSLAQIYSDKGRKILSMPEILRRSLLFVPGNNERMMKKSMSLDCDYVIFDLEDAVPPDQKQEAREMILKVLKESDSRQVSKTMRFSVRVNQLDNAKLSRQDLETFGNVENISSIMVPKAEDERGIQEIYRSTGKRTIPLIESPKGFLKLANIAACDGVEAISYGAADMALSMKGSVRAFQKSESIKTSIAIAARCYGIDPIDQVFFELNDLGAFRKESMDARKLGYSGKLLIHPSQVSIANLLFSSSSIEDLDWARDVIQAYEKSLTQEGSKGAIRLRGQLIDGVHYKMAKEMIKNDSRREKDS